MTRAQTSSPDTMKPATATHYTSAAPTNTAQQSKEKPSKKSSSIMKSAANTTKSTLICSDTWTTLPIQHHKSREEKGLGGSGQLLSPSHKFGSTISIASSNASSKENTLPSPQITAKPHPISQTRHQLGEWTDLRYVPLMDK